MTPDLGAPLTLCAAPAHRLIANSFASDKAFQNMLNAAFEFFINLNARSPEYISLFMDDKLRKGLKDASEDAVEGVLDKVMMLFRYLQEKDVFEKYYKQHLAKRLLSGRTVRRPKPCAQAMRVCCTYMRWISGRLPGPLDRHDGAALQAQASQFLHSSCMHTHACAVSGATWHACRYTAAAFDPTDSMP